MSTPLHFSNTSQNVWFKLEFNQFTGSFKERGARYTLLTLMNLDGFDKTKGVVAASAGNHALALAYHGGLLGIKITVVMPDVAPLAKVDKCRLLGANVIIKGGHIGESKIHAEKLVKTDGLTYVNGYDDKTICAGAGTVGMEIIEQGERERVMMSLSLSTLGNDVRVALGAASGRWLPRTSSMQQCTDLPGQHRSVGPI